MVYILELLLFIGVYFVAGKFGLFIDGFGDQIASVNLWPPAGIALAVLLLYGYRFLPGIFIGAFLVSLSTGIRMPVPIVVGIGSTLTPFVAAFILKRFIQFNTALERTHDVVGFTLIAFPISSSIIATAMTVGFIKGGFIPPAQFLATWIAIWVSNYLSSFVVGAFLLVWLTPRQINIYPKRILEAGCLAVVVAILAFFMFTNTIDKTTAITYWAFIPLTWTALRFGIRETVSVIFAFSVVAIWSILVGAGPISNINKNASLFYLESFMTVVATTSMILAAVVAERKELEKRKDNFISIASHELKTPLTSIKMITQLLQKMDKQEKVKKESLYLTNIDQQVDKITYLINEMLDLSKIQVGKLKLRKEKTSLDHLVHETVQGMQATTHHAIEVKGSIIHFVSLDPERISQVLINLLSNAIKYSPTEKEIIVTLSESEQQVEVSVKDRGIGIPTSKQPQIFERFYRVHEGSEKTFSGFGLGLYIASKIIKQHNGKIWVDSVEGKGSTFYFSLPKAA